MNKILSILLVCALTFSQLTIAAPLTVSGDDSIQTVLNVHKGKKVTVKLNSGEEMSGTVAEVTGKLVVLQELTGKEFYDAAISLDKVAAVIVRAREQ